MWRLNPQWSFNFGSAATLEHIQTITLDLDDTLWEIHPVIKRAEQTLYAWLAERYPRITEMHQPDDIRTVRKGVVAEFADRVHDLTFLRRTVLSRIGFAAGYKDDFIDEAFAVFDAVRNDVELFPGALAALQTLKANYTLVAVTNGNANLEAIGISHLFDDIVTASRAGAAKPAAQIFELAVRIGGADPHATLHVGDHEEYDVAGARACGLATAWVNRHAADWPQELVTPDIEVGCFSELPTRLGLEH